jgi:hypothetical protein
MTELAVRSTIPAMSPRAIANVRELEARVLALPQTPIETHHAFHAGVYARTIMAPAGTLLTGALIKIATLLILDGDADVYLDGESRRFTGYHVLPASAGRKQAFVTHADTHLTMLFATQAKTVEDAERAFTDEADLLGSRRDSNRITITGE